jgi:hypothetical protein
MKSLPGLAIHKPLEHRPLIAIYTELGLALLARAEHASQDDERRRWAAEAALAFSAALGEPPPQAALTLYLARAYDLQGNGDEAVRCYLEAARGAPDVYMGVAADAVRRLLTTARATSQAPLLAWFGEAARAALPEAGPAAASVIVGYAALRREDYAQAARSFEQAIASPGLDHELRLILNEGLGETLVRDRRVAGLHARRERAAAILERACEAIHEQDDPTREVRALVLRAEALSDLGRYDEALEASAEALALEAGYEVELELIQARCHYERGDTAAAAAIIERQMKNFAALPGPLQAQTLALQACLDYDQQLYDRAIERADTARDRVPDHALALRIGAQARLALSIGAAARAESAGGAQTPDDLLEVAISLLQRYARVDPGGASRAAPLIAAQSELAAAEMEWARLDELVGDDPATVVERAMARYNAGRRRYLRRQYSAAIDHLEHAQRLLPAHQPTYWYLADALIFDTIISKPQGTEASARQIAQARAVWSAGLALGPPSDDFAWAYYTMAVICDSKALEPEQAAQRAKLWFEGLVWCEARLQRDAQNSETRMLQMRLYRCLDLTANALALSESFEEESEELFLLDERTAILANTGQFAKAAAFARKRLELLPDPWVKGALAFTSYQLRQFEVALPILLEAQLDGIDQLWIQSLVAGCYRRLGNIAAAREAYEKIWSQRDDERYQASKDACATAAHALGTELGEYHPEYLQQAAAILESIKDDPAYDRGGNWRELGEVYLALGDQRALPTFREALAEINDYWVLEKLRAYDLGELRANASGWEHHAQAIAIIDQVEAILDSRIASFHEPTPTEELQNALTSQGISALEEAVVAIKAGLARHARQQRDWATAARLYRELLDGGRFPEAGNGLAHCTEQLLATGDTQLKAGDPAAANALFLQVERLSATLPAQPAARLDLPARRGLAAFAIGDHDIALDHFVAALAETGGGGAALASSLRPRIRDTAQYWALNDALAAWAVEEELDPELRQQLAEAGRGLAAYLDTLVTPGAEQLMIPVVTPVVFELSDALVPFVDSRQDNGYFLYELIPAMQDRIAADTGVRVPGLRARGNYGLEPGAYEMQLDEVPVSGGVAMLGHRYVDGPLPEAAGIRPGPDGVASSHPVTGAPGYWLSETRGPALEAAGVKALSTPEFLIAHIEAVLRRHLARFVGVQETEILLVKWANLPGGKELVATALPSSLARLRLTWLLKGLLREGVPLLDWEGILAVAAELDIATAPIGALLRAARLRLRAHLPGNRPGVARFTLPADFEEQLVGADAGRPFFAAGPAQKHAVLLWLREQMASVTGAAALVTRSHELRPLLRRLVEPEFPDLAVLAAEELLTNHREIAALSSDAPVITTGAPGEEGAAH